MPVTTSFHTKHDVYAVITAPSGDYVALGSWGAIEDYSWKCLMKFDHPLDWYHTAVLEIKLQRLDRFTVPLLPSDPKFNPNQPQATKEEVKRVTIKTYTLIFTGKELLTDPRSGTVPQRAKRVENEDTH